MEQVGRNLEQRGRRVGRQAQIMPVLHSMADQVAALMLSSVIVFGGWLVCCFVSMIYASIACECLQVGSVDSEMLSRVCKRTMLVMQTLYHFRLAMCCTVLTYHLRFITAEPNNKRIRGRKRKRRKKEEKTHKPPNAKITIIATLCLNGIPNPVNAGIGITNTAKSVRICIHAFENHNAFMLKQNPPEMGSQNFRTGTQVRNAVTTAQVP